MRAYCCMCGSEIELDLDDFLDDEEMDIDEFYCDLCANAVVGLWSDYYLRVN